MNARRVDRMAHANISMVVATSQWRREVNPLRLRILICGHLPV